MAESAASLIGPSLEKICEAASGKKYTTLRHEAKQILTFLDEIFKVPAPSEPEAARSSTPLAAKLSIETMAQAEKARVAAILADQAKAEAAQDSQGPGLVLRESPPKSSAEASEAQVDQPGPDGSSEVAGVQTEHAAEASDETPDGGNIPSLEQKVSVATLVEDARADTQSPVNALGEGQKPTLQSEAPTSFKGSMSLKAANTLMEVLRSAVDSKKVQLVDLALDLIQKLIAHQHIQGPVASISHRRDPSKKARGRRATEDDEELEAVGGDSVLPQAVALELLCHSDDIPDDGVELRVLKGLLTAVTSTTVHVHGQALLLAVRTCYNIFLMSRSEVNQTTAKASLTQMLNIVFQRMEAGSETVQPLPMAVSDQLGLPPAESSNVTAFVNTFLHEVLTSVDPFGYYSEGIQQKLDDAFVGSEPGLEASTPLATPSGEKASEQTTFKQEAAQEGTASTEALSETGRVVENGDRVRDTVVSSPVDGLSRSTSFAPSSSQPITIEAVLQKDCFLAFRALCKLSIRSADGSTGTDVTVIRGKVLALELIKILLENSGPVFQHSEKFVAAIKQYLCLSLLKNVTSSYPQAQTLTCSIFYTLLSKFRHSLKAEIGVFFPMILLRAVEPVTSGASPNTSGPTGASAPIDVAHKTVVLRCLEAICDNGQLLVDIFVNYDCDLEGANLFERLVNALVRIAQGNQDKEAQASVQPDEQRLRINALSCLVRILRALVEWYMHATAQSQKAVGAPGRLTEDVGVHQNWQTLQSVQSGIRDRTPRPSVEDAKADGSTLRRDGTMTSLMASLTAPLDAEMQAQLKDADPQMAAQQLESWKAYKKGFQEGIALFNQKPKKGVAFLQDQGMLGKEPVEVAKFLAKTAGLNKTMIGEYLGERDDLCIKVMHAYVDALDFASKEFDVAIRMFLDGFRLPGEAQKIDRLVEKFAERYVSCNAESYFRSADVAYVLAYSVVMLNTDAHNPQVKTKMTKQDWMRNNRGINDGSDLPEDYMSTLYESIVFNEIKMKDSAIDVLHSQQNKAAGGWMDTILNLIPGRKQQSSNEPSEEAIKRTHDFLRQKAKGATFFEATDGETARPMLDICWAPMLGALSILFEELSDGLGINMCLAGMVAAIRITSLLEMGMLRNAFVTSICRLTMLHAPAQMQVKNAKAFRALLVVADENGDHLHEVWQDVMRCVSRWELLQSIHSGTPPDAVIFAQPTEPPSPAKRRTFFSALRPFPTRESSVANGKAGDNFHSVRDVSLHHPGRGKGGKNESADVPPDDVIEEIDAQELNRVFVKSEQLGSDAIVEFVKALVMIAEEELQPVNTPRVFSLTKIVEISHFNMARIRLVWNRIWAVLSNFFVQVGCHKNLQVAIYAVDSLRQLAMKFLERDELANYSFQTLFMTPLVVVMRQSKAVEIRELIIRCVSQMVLARVNNVKSGWKSMFMVFTTAASDESQMIVRLAFETIEKIVREHFDFITETEVTTFTDCVNCLIAFTNNPHSLDVALNAIAFLRFCAMRLAEGAIGDVEELPEGAAGYSHNVVRIQPSRSPQDAETSASDRNGGLTSTSQAANSEADPGALMQFSDRDEHVYFWFPLLAGLSELTFDPRPDIRHSALEVLFDTLKFHGGAFTTPFWMRIFDSVLLPIFDHVRAEVTDTTTFTDEMKRAEVDAWLYETCTKCLQHIIDIVDQYYKLVKPIIPKILDLLANFIRRPHQSLASVGTAALVRLALSTGSRLSPEAWAELLQTLSNSTEATLPDIESLVTSLAEHRTSVDSTDEGLDNSEGPWSIQSPSQSPRALLSRAHTRQQVSLASGSGARRLNLAKCRASIQLLLVQVCGEIWSTHGALLNQEAVIILLSVVEKISFHARAVDGNVGLRRELANAQTRDKVVEGRGLRDPPLMLLENEAGKAYISMLTTIYVGALSELKDGTNVENRLLSFCSTTMQNFEAIGNTVGADGAAEPQEGIARLLSVKEEALLRSQQVVSVLNALQSLTADAFRRHLRDLFPILTSLIACQHTPVDVQTALSELFMKRIGPLLFQK